jgi:hypothetical protein
MKRTVNILVAVLTLVFCLDLLAQQKGKAKKIFKPTVYLGQSELSGGPVKKDDFTRLLKQGLTSRDSVGDKYRIVSFDFIYGERILYEDSIGNLKVYVDYNTSYCPGDTITTDMARTVHAEQSKTGEESPGIYDRVKPGDTIYFDHIRVERLKKNSVISISDTIPIAGRGMKFWIVK